MTKVAKDVVPILKKNMQTSRSIMSRAKRYSMSSRNLGTWYPRGASKDDDFKGGEHFILSSFEVLCYLQRVGKAMCSLRLLTEKDSNITKIIIIVILSVSTTPHLVRCATVP